MRRFLSLLTFAALLMCASGCRSEVGNDRISSQYRRQTCRLWTPKQIDVLRSFALQESPSLWQTVQALRGEVETTKTRLKNLRTDLLEFGRNPDEDKDYAELRESCVGLCASLEVVYLKLEEAYIAYKKYQATPGKNEYGDIMRHALDEGVREADEAISRYRALTVNK